MLDALTPGFQTFKSGIVTGDEKWIQYYNPKYRRSWGKPCHASVSSAKPNIYGSKLLFCILWDQQRFFISLYYKLFQASAWKRLLQEIISIDAFELLLYEQRQQSDFVTQQHLTARCKTSENLHGNA